MFERYFHESLCPQGVCFAFAVFFLKETPTQTSQTSCRDSLIRLQLAHEASVRDLKELLTKDHREAWNIRFLKKESFGGFDAQAIEIKVLLDEWRYSNKTKNTCIILSLPFLRFDGSCIKHFVPLLFVPQKNVWEVGDTTFALDADGKVLRYQIPDADVMDYVAWQVDYGCRLHNGSLRDMQFLHIRLLEKSS